MAVEKIDALHEGMANGKDHIAFVPDDQPADVLLLKLGCFDGRRLDAEPVLSQGIQYIVRVRNISGEFISGRSRLTTLEDDALGHDGVAPHFHD